MKTEFFVEYMLFDVKAQEDATESSDTNASFGDFSIMKKLRAQSPRYGTLEHNFFTLDESFKEFPDEPEDLAYFSSVQSDNNGTFNINPSVIINFSENHASTGITLHFLDSYPLEIKVSWYTLGNALISEKSFYPDRLMFYCDNSVSQYGRIVIEFVKTMPYRNVKLQFLEYGVHLLWGADMVKSAKLISETDPTGDKMITDKLDFSFFDSPGSFNPSKSGNLFQAFERKQRMAPCEIVDGEYIPLGTFYMESVKYENNICSISAIDYKGLLEYSDFRVGRVYNGDLAGDVIDEIMAAAKIEEYTVDDATANTPLYGTLGIQTCQSALRQVLFACRSVADTSRTDKLEIKRVSDDVISGTITKKQKFTTKTTLDKYVSDITVSFENWKLESEPSEITKGTYAAGTHTIQFSEPCQNVSASNAAILEQKPYYVVISVATESEVVITGKKYVSEKLSATASIEHIKAGELRSAKTFSGTLMNFKMAQQAANDILAYYQKQWNIQTKHISGDEKVGGYVEIENPEEGCMDFVAVLESATIDLTGGFISSAKFRGALKEDNSGVDI